MLNIRDAMDTARKAAKVRKGSKLEGIFHDGFRRGVNCAIDVAQEVTIGARLSPHLDWVGYVGMLAAEMETYGRQYADDPTYGLRGDRQWEVYEAGVEAGIHHWCATNADRFTTDSE